MQAVARTSNRRAGRGSGIWMLLFLLSVGAGSAMLTLAMLVFSMPGR